MPIIYNLAITLEFYTYRSIFPFIYDHFQYLPRFLKIWFVLIGQIQIVSSFSSTRNMIWFITVNPVSKVFED